jgi:phosphoribosylformylglycinamidine synthase
MPATPPAALVIRTAGTNCDRELCHALQLAGAAPERVHLHQLIDDPQRLEAYQIISFPGGFSYGDDVAAGRILATHLRLGLLEPLRAAIDRGVPMIGICNGFQVLVKLGLLPDPHADGQTVTLADNTSGRFMDRWVPLEAPADTTCIWTRGLGDGEPVDLPIAHGEGRFVAPPEVLDELEAAGQVALRYVDDVNGSDRRIAGVCDPTGLVLGLMPHPERCTEVTHHPQWTRRRWAGGDGPGDGPGDSEPVGLQMFRQAVGHVVDG